MLPTQIRCKIIQEESGVKPQCKLQQRTCYLPTAYNKGSCWLKARNQAMTYFLCHLVTRHYNCLLLYTVVQKSHFKMS